jgi:hypothetical protein
VTDPSDIPDAPLERAKMLENLHVARATGDMSANSSIYEHLRREFMADAALKPLLPEFVRTCRTLNVFWPFIKEKAGTYADRRKYIADAFSPLMDYLEGSNRAPGDTLMSDAMIAFDAEGVHAVWEKALQRRENIYEKPR